MKTFMVTQYSGITFKVKGKNISTAIHKAGYRRIIFRSIKTYKEVSKDCPLPKGKVFMRLHEDN